MERIIIFDTTLRDGDQASGFHMLKEEKIEIAKQLARLGVDVIEVGFPASSPGDFKAVNEIAKIVGNENGPVICALARAVDEDIDIAGKAIEPAHKKRIHTFIATSQIHIEDKYKKDKFWVIEQAVKAVKKAKTYTQDVEFSCEDFGRTDKDYIVEVVIAVIKAGATTINLPDTVGWLTPSECYEKVKYVIEKVRRAGLNAIFSVHNHNDFGMGTATSIEAVKAGARQVEVTINGIGERAGNTALEEVVAILKTRNLGETNINTKLIGETSRLVSRITGISPQPNKAVVGKNAFSHEAGIHQDGVIKSKSTYEIMEPEDYGVESIITFGPRSGRRALKAKYLSLGINLSDEEFENSAKRFMSLADNLKETDDADIIVSIADKEIPSYYELVSYNPKINKEISVEVKLRVGDEEKILEAGGNGQVDAAISAIKKILSRDYSFDDFLVISEGKGSNAIGFTKIKASKNSWHVIGKSKDTDIIKASIKAFLDACNRLKFIEEYFNFS